MHRAFLGKLKALLPETVTPILMKDAGFRAPWFKAVNRQGWHWIGRIRNRDYLRPQGGEIWAGCKTLYAQATARPQALGLHDIVRSNPVTCHLYLIKRPKQHRIRKSVFGQPVRSNQSLKQARAQREPWLIAASLSLAHLHVTQIINHYGARMQIEEAFRDLKCARYGLSFALHLSRSRERLATPLLIALLTFFVLWLIGQHALARGLHLHYQSNTRRTRPVLCVFNLACQLVRHTIDNALGRNMPGLNLPHPLPLPPRPRI